MGAFTKAFSPITAELEYEAHVKLILDIVLLTVAVALVFAVEAAVSHARPSGSSPDPN